MPKSRNFGVYAVQALKELDLKVILQTKVVFARYGLAEMSLVHL